eukprot:3374607-Pyramimonas_sp.AAC.1
MRGGGSFGERRQLLTFPIIGQGQLRAAESRHWQVTSEAGRPQQGAAESSIYHQRVAETSRHRRTRPETSKGQLTPAKSSRDERRAAECAYIRTHVERAGTALEGPRIFRRAPRLAHRGCVRRSGELILTSRYLRGGRAGRALLCCEYSYMCKETVL